MAIYYQTDSTGKITNVMDIPNEEDVSKWVQDNCALATEPIVQLSDGSYAFASDVDEDEEAAASAAKALAEAKARKLAEVNAWTENKIIGGFVSACTGTNVTYDSDVNTQLTVSSDLNTIYLNPDAFAINFPTGYPMRGYPDGTDTTDKTNKVIYNLTKEQLLQWNVDLGLHRGNCKQNGWIKQAEVNAATTVDAVDAVVLN